MNRLRNFYISKHLFIFYFNSFFNFVLIKIKELNGLVESVVKSLLKQIDNANSSSKQSSYALELFNHLISHADLSNEQTLAFAQHLWTLALKNGTSKFHEQIIAAIRNRSQSKSEYKVLRQKLGLKL